MKFIQTQCQQMKSDNDALYRELQDLEYDVISKTDAIKYITESINEIKRQIVTPNR